MQRDHPANVSLVRGDYEVAVTDLSGRVLETFVFLASSDDFTLHVGCLPAKPAGNDTDKPSVQTTFYNTLDTCGLHKNVVVYVNGRKAGSVAPGSSADVYLPSKDILLEYVVEGGRFLVEYYQKPKRKTLYVGCTDPEAGTDDVLVVFENRTQSCTNDRTYLTLWADGRPRLGLAPGRRGAVRLTKGRHWLEVRRGWSRRRVMVTQKDITRPILVHWGCERR